MELRFNLGEIVYLAEQGMEVMRAENPDAPAILNIAPHLAVIANALAFAGPKCLADYTVTLDILDVFGD